MTNEKILVFLPTYNEKDNVENIFAKLNTLGLNLDILFLDDNSPDGTGRILDRLASQYSHLKVIHRSGRLGIGSAHVDGIRWAYDQGYKTLVTMDCDFTHSPEYIHEFIKAGATNDVVVGSRYMMDESLVEWNLFRKGLTSLGHVLTKRLLKMEYDATGAFRLYNLTRIPRQTFDLVASKGYSFFFESLYVLHLNGYSIHEVPIMLPARTYGSSKMSIKEVFRSLKRLGDVYKRTLLHKESFLLPEPIPQLDPTLSDDQGWDDYWNKKDRPTNLAYDLIAIFYRKFIIRPLLNHFVSRYLPVGANVLHAGCGSGQVDTDVRKKVAITALDISAPALSIYGKTNGRACKLLHGSIFKIPSSEQSFDGIYNLGVMEHFSESQIHDILLEFHRVLKSNGRLLLFWPPEFGSSVIFLKGVHFVLNRVLKKNIQLHPDEISRIRSKKQVERILAAAGFTMENYYFGMRDLFTYVVVVAKPGRATVTASSERVILGTSAERSQTFVPEILQS